MLSIAMKYESPGASSSLPITMPQIAGLFIGKFGIDHIPKTPMRDSEYQTGKLMQNCAPEDELDCPK